MNKVRQATYDQETAPAGEGPGGLPKLYSVTLYPHRSLDRRLYRRLGLGLLALCCIAALRFVAVGAWPVAVFVAVDIAALWFAFHLNYRRARLYETIQLTERDLIVTRVHANRQTESWRFDPYWCRVKLEKTDDGNSNRLSLTSRGEYLAVGAFLSPPERMSLFQSLNHALSPLKGF